MLYFFDRVVNIFYHPQKILRPPSCLLSLSLLPPLIEYRNTSLLLSQRLLLGLYHHHPKLLNYIHVHSLIQWHSESNHQVMSSLKFYPPAKTVLSLVTNCLLSILISKLILDFEPMIFWNVLGVLYLLLAVGNF